MRSLRFMRLEKTPSESISSLFQSRVEEKRIREREGQRSEIREKPSFQDPQRPLEKGRRDYCLRVHKKKVRVKIEG